ncbi:MAG: DUF559 domain-containing protein [Nitrospira sp.]|nr:DUF559 domain-containing protein [Nitrospira sp.]
MRVINSLSSKGSALNPLREAIEFYQHKHGWSNRLIAGDSLLVMNSLLEKEGMAGKVQMIYIDPPYGITYKSNFQPFVNKRDVKDGKDEDLTQVPEEIKAFRDTWELGIHSYLTYLRDRLLLARELLTESGSIFVQISDENLHLLRQICDEVFGAQNFCAVITVQKTSATTDLRIPTVADFLLWYGKDLSKTKYRQLYLPKEAGEQGATIYTWIENDDGSYRQLGKEELTGGEPLRNAKLFATSDMTSSHEYSLGKEPFRFAGNDWSPGNRYWSTSPDGMSRLASANRLVATGKNLFFKRYLQDFPVRSLTNIWTDTSSSFASRIYVVQTIHRTVERCLLMTTDPGDLVFDPTCVRKGTRVWVVSPPVVPQQATGDSHPVILPHAVEEPPVVPPQAGVQKDPLPARGEGWGGATTLAVYGEGWGGATTLAPIETLAPGDWVLGHDGLPHRVLRVIGRHYRGTMIGLRHKRSNTVLWLTADHKVLAKLRPRTLGGKLDWSGIPKSLRGRSRELRREMTPPERKLWQALRNRQVKVKFRRQHPIGPYIADFYSRDTHLVVEVDGAAAHGTAEAIVHDQARDAYLQSLGLRVFRVSAAAVMHDLEGVCEAIRLICDEQMAPAGADWVEASALAVGDVVFFGPEREGVHIDEIFSMDSEEMVYDPEVEDAHSFLTEVCAVHNCGSGTTAYVAEQWGRRWITCDTPAWR